MFSGIVEGTGRVNKISQKKDIISIEISPPKGFNKNLKKGASVSVDGVCLTSLDKGLRGLKFDIVEETLSRTNFEEINKGSLVNLERSIKYSTEIGGHLMSGHIHFTGKIRKIINKINTKDIIVSFPKKFNGYVFETIGKVNKDSFYIHLIPETLSVTNLDSLEEGSSVNVEIDQNTISVVETVKRALAAQKSR